MGAARIRLAVLILSALAVGQASARYIVAVGLMADRAIFKIDGETRLLRVGESVDDMTLVSVSASEAVLRIGKQEAHFPLGADHGGIKAQEGAAEEVQINANAHGQYITGGMINGRIVQFLVDTGADTVSMTRADAIRLGLDFRRDGEPAASSTANGIVRSWRVLLDKVKVGGITLSGVEATVRDTEDAMPILLGMSFLGRIRMTHEQHRLVLTDR